MDYTDQMPGMMAAVPEAAAAEVPMQKSVIGPEEIREAELIRNKYKQGKSARDQQIVDNEKWYRQRHWEVLRQSSKTEVEPTSGWLFNAIANKHADIMDNFPAPNILPREPNDAEQAKMLSSIVPVVLEQCDFEQVYDDVNTIKLHSGTGAYGIFWDSSKLFGLGDVSIRKMNILSMFWESGIEDIQESRNVFTVELVDLDVLKDAYPEIGNRVTAGSEQMISYVHDDTIDTSNKVAVVDWYYKKGRPGGGQVLHYCKYCQDVVLFATENEPEYAERGWYDDGMYPFVLDKMYPLPGYPTGFGLVDVAKSAQEYIDRGNQAFMQNMLANTRPRNLVREDAGINEEELLDYTAPLVHYSGAVDAGTFIPIQGKPLPGSYQNIMEAKVQELKEITGNRDISTGGTSSGVTAASAIAAMQEAGSKLSRDNNKGAYRAYRKIVMMVIERIRQFYDMPRYFRILGAAGAYEYAQYSNAGIVPQPMQGADGSLENRMPIFDIQVSAQKASAYSKLSQNELALQFYSAGFFEPQRAMQAMACLKMMDFDRKEEIMQTILQNQQIYMSMMGPMGMGMMPQAGGDQDGGASAAGNEALGGEEGGEPATTRKARERVANSTRPT